MQKKVITCAIRVLERGLEGIKLAKDCTFCEGTKKCRVKDVRCPHCF